MADGSDLDKLFEAALNEKQAPSRFGTPEEQRKSAPAAFRRPAQGNSDHSGASTFRAAASVFQAAPPVSEADSSAFQAAPAPDDLRKVTLDANGEASLDSSINAELAAIMDTKVSKEKRLRKRGFLMTILFFVGIAGGATGWVVANPERFEALKLVIAEIKSVGDVQGMVAKYQNALDKVAVRGKQIDAATSSMGVDPSSVNEQVDPGFDKEMKAMMGEEGGKTTAARDKILREKLGDVQESGSLIKKKNDAPAETVE